MHANTVFLKGPLKVAFFILSGIGCAAFGLEIFLLPNRFMDGGATGISLLIAELPGIPRYYLLLAVHIPFLIFGLGVAGVLQSGQGFFAMNSINDTRWGLIKKQLV
jgi:uncharacterized membrane-anchored protein YitT (DUF2179 family)